MTIADFQKTLNDIHRSAFPVAIRQSLNDVAMNMKKEELPKSFDDAFDHNRRKNFLKAHSGATLINSSEFDIDRMESKAGIYDRKNNNNSVAQGLESQEVGGVMNNRAVPLDSARVKDENTVIQKRFYYRYYKGKQKGFVARNKRGGVFKGNNGAVLLFTKDREWIPIFTRKKTIKIDKNPFVKPAMDEAYKKFSDFFLKRAEQRIKKYLNK